MPIEASGSSGFDFNEESCAKNADDVHQYERLDLLAMLSKHRHSAKAFCYFLRGNIEEAITFSQFFNEAARFRRHYSDAGIVQGATIIIAAEFSPEILYAFVGALIGGFIPAFLAPFTEKQNFDQFSKTISGVIQYVKPGVIVASPGPVETLVPAGVPLLLLQTGQAAALEEYEPWIAAEPEAVAFMQFSSGTTGLRKGVMLRHREVMEQIKSVAQVVNLGKDDLIVSWLPVYHDMGLIACFIIPLALGIPVSLQDPIEWVRAPERLLAAIEKHRATYCWLPNFAFNHLCLTVPQKAQYGLSSIKAFINCSEPCKPATFDKFIERFSAFGVRPEMLACSYAMAEAVFAVTHTPVGQAPLRRVFDRDKLRAEKILAPCDQEATGIELVSSGHVLPGLKLSVLDDAGQEQKQGHIGQIALSGDFVFKGYHNNPEETEAAFRDGWYMTGDLGAVVEGEVFITGREKEIIIVNGKNFYAHDIEACAAAVEGVKPGRAVAFAIDNIIIESEEAVLVVETEWKPEKYRELASVIKQAAADTLGLTAIRVYPVAPRWLIKTTSGKISRMENRNKYSREKALV